MTKKLYLPLLMAMVVALFSSCSKKWVRCQLITSLLLRKCWKQ